MILNTFENRMTVTQYLEAIDEDTFINEFVVPLFSSQGYYLYRINPHGPGEHGKDLIFYRHVPFFYDNEFLVIQAKSEKLTTSNVEKFSSQIIRALKIPFTAKSGGGELRAHYAIFINSKKHTNDADFEFQKLIHNIPHIKILNQETVCELIMKSGIAPEHLLKLLSISTTSTQTKNDDLVYDTIMSNKPGDIDDLLSHKLKFIKDGIGPRTKELVIDYIYDRWQMDRSWAGTVKPMKWFDMYFEFFTGKHSKYLLTILDEYRSSTPSFDAMQYTQSIVRKITPEMLASIENEFIGYCAMSIRSYPQDRIELVIEKLSELFEADLIRNQDLKEMAEKILLFEDYKKQGQIEKYRELVDDIDQFIYRPF